MKPMIEIDGLAKHFGPLVAVDNVSFAVAQGEVLGFLGPNGAGKSTTMKMATGFIPPDRGTARICGFDILEAPIDAKANLGYLPEGAPAYGDMTPRTFLSFCAEARGYTGFERDRRVEFAAERVEIGDVLDQQIETLSKGFKRRVGIAQAILHDPPVLIMDEPTDGLDPNQKHEVRTLIRAMAEKKAIVISTHILEEVEQVCSRAIVIAAGRIVADGTPAELAQRSRYHNAVTISIFDGPEAARAKDDLAKVANVEAIEPAPGRKGIVSWTLLPKGGVPLLDAVSAVARNAIWEVEELKVEAGRLDEVFRNVTLGAGRS